MDDVTSCYCFDIDGVLANHSHRKHLVAGQTKNWAAYNEAAAADPPIEAMVAVARALSSQYPIVYVTGRSEAYREQTLAWLRGHGLPAGALYMRSADEVEGSDASKARLMRRVLSDGYAPLLAFDDRAAVVEAWHQLGVACCLVAPGMRRPVRLSKQSSRVRTRCRTFVRV